MEQWSVEQLLRDLDSPLARAEIERRVAKNKVTSLVVRMLLPKSIHDSDDAFLGLCKTCFRALGGLYFAPTRADWAKAGDGLATSNFDAKADFIARAIADILRPYFGKTEKEILTSALVGEFRHIPRAVKFDAIDALRSGYRRMNSGKSFVDLSFKLGKDEEGEELTFEGLIVRPKGKTDNSSLLSPPAARARHASNAEIMQKFHSKHARWIRLLGEAGWETLLTVVEQYADGAADGPLRNWKGSISRAVAAKRHVSRTQAQADLRHLRGKMAESLTREWQNRDARPLVSEVWELFSVPGDEPRVFSKKTGVGTLLSLAANEKEGKKIVARVRARVRTDDATTLRSAA